MLHRTLTAMFPDGIPAYLTDDPNPAVSSAIEALPVHWHAYLYLKYIARRNKGYTFTLRDACNTVIEHKLANKVNQHVQAAVAAYLRHLSQRHALLIAPEADTLDGTYCVT